MRLYNVLLTIGRVDKSIRLSVLEKYEPLLRCPEVRRRAQLDASRHELAIHARQALLDAIEDVVVPTDRLVAQAALCTTEQFEGLRVSERQSSLMDLRHGRITPDVFKRRRRQVLHDIVRALQSAPLSLPRPSTSGTVHQQPAPRKQTALEGLAHEAADLHYGGLLSLFVDQMRAEGIQLDVRPEAWGACAVFMFQTFVPLVMQEGRAEAVLSALSSETRTTAAVLYKGVIESGPALSEGELEGIENYRYGLAGWLTHPDGMMLAIYNDSWDAWYRDRVADRLNRAGIEAVTARSGALARIILQNIGSKHPVLSDARRSALQTLAYYCDFPEHAPIFDGRSIHYLAEAYFDSNSDALATEALQWYDKS